MINTLIVSRFRFLEINIFHINNFHNTSTNREYYLHLGDKEIFNEFGTHQ